jgi:lysophospholipase L1-like esterase
MPTLSRRSLLAIGGGLLAGCSTTKTFAGREGTASTAVPVDGTDPSSSLVITSLAMVGDSITDGSSDELRDLFADLAIDEVYIDGEASRRVLVGSGRNGHSLSGVGAVQALLDDGVDPSVWVIALGTNDVGGLGTPQEVADLIAEITVLLSPAAPLVWANVYRPSDLRQTQLFNDVLEEQLELRGNAVVADWYEIASDPDLDVLRGDNLHPNETGQLAFAELIVQALQRL